MRYLNFVRFCLGCSASLFQVLVRVLAMNSNCVYITASHGTMPERPGHHACGMATSIFHVHLCDAVIDPYASNGRSSSS